MNNAISLIVATLNRTDELARFIESLGPVTGIAIDLIIVDQNRDDRIDRLLADTPRNPVIDVQHLRFDRNNQSLARNYGLTKARYDLIGFPDDDCWYEPDTLARVMAIFTDQPALGAILGRWVEHAVVVPAQAEPVSLRSLLDFRSVPTSAIIQFFRREALPAADPFDHQFGAYRENGGYFGCGEETDLMISVARRGHTVLFSPEVRVHHKYAPRRFDSLEQQFAFTRHRARGTGGLYAKHQSAPYVVLRGLTSPFIRSWRYVFRPAQFVTHTALWLGRVEGYLRWWHRYGRHRHPSL